TPLTYEGWKLPPAIAAPPPASLFGQLGGGRAGEGDDRDRGVPDYLGRPRSEEHPCQRPGFAGTDHQQIAGGPVDVVEGILPVVALSNDDLRITVGCGGIGLHGHCGFATDDLRPHLQRRGTLYV